MTKFSFVIIIALAFGFLSLQQLKQVNTPSQEGQIEWMSFEEAVKKAREDKEKNGQSTKKILIDVYTDWCGWCKKMDKATFQHASIAPYVNEHFYAVKLNAEQKEDIQFDGKTFKFVASGRSGYHELAAALLKGQLSFPTVVFLDEQFRMIQPIPGYQGPKQFDTILHYLAEDHFLKTPWDKFQASYTSAIE